jgi:hypothetical protein
VVPRQKFISNAVLVNSWKLRRGYARGSGTAVEPSNFAKLKRIALLFFAGATVHHGYPADRGSQPQSFVC